MLRMVDFFTGEVSTVVEAYSVMVLHDLGFDKYLVKSQVNEQVVGQAGFGFQRITLTKD